MNFHSLLELPTYFTAGQYLYWTRIECLGWTAADVAIVFYVLRLANLARAAAQKPPHVFSYAALAATLLFTPIVFMADDGWSIFAVELAITIPHFLLILYAGITDLRLFPLLLANILNGISLTSKSEGNPAWKNSSQNHTP